MPSMSMIDPAARRAAAPPVPRARSENVTFRITLRWGNSPLVLRHVADSPVARLQVRDLPPPMRIVPAEGCTSPQMLLMSRLLPLPVAPMRTKYSPAATCRDTSRSWNVPAVRHRPPTSIIPPPPLAADELVDGSQRPAGQHEHDDGGRRATSMPPVDTSR